MKYSKKDKERAEKEARKKNEENVKKRTENEARKKAEENIKKRTEKEAWRKDKEKAENEANISNSNDILAENNSVEIVKFLLRNGADINAKDKNGWNPLHRAIWFGKIEIVSLNSKCLEKARKKAKDNAENYNSILGIKKGTPLTEELNRETKALEYHPDKKKSEGAMEKFKRIQNR